MAGSWSGRWPDIAPCGLLETAAVISGSVARHPRLIPSEPGAGTAAALQFRKGPPSMMYDLTLPVMVPAAGVAVLAVVYVMSKDPGRRDRAWRLLRFLFRR
jgi:hypothetical protein